MKITILIFTLVAFTIPHLNGQTFGSFTDRRDGRVYKTIKIGNQIWMAENFRATAYSNGDPIQNATNVAKWVRYSAEEEPAYCTDEDGNVFYNRLAVLDRRGLAPAGWRIPTNFDYEELLETTKRKYRSITGDHNYGRMLADVGVWRFRSNQTGFSAKLLGARQPDGVFKYNGTYAYFWGIGYYRDGTLNSQCSLSLGYGVSYPNYQNVWYAGGNGQNLRLIKN